MRTWFIDFLTTEGEYFLRMLISAVCGGLIGLERKRRMKEAGVRTHLLVGLGSAMMMLVSKYGFFDVVIFNGVSADASRIAANIITGVSFLGAGVIFVRRGSISGLTTAAGIWVTSGVGLAIGAGMYAIGVAATGFMLLIQVLLHRQLGFLEGPYHGSISMLVKDSPGIIDRLGGILGKHSLEVTGAEMHRQDGGTLEIEFEIKARQLSTQVELLAELQSDGDVYEVTM